MTFAEVYDAFLAKRDYDWEHTAGLMALIANCNRDKKQNPRAFKPEDFYRPQLRPKHQQKLTRAKLHTFKGLFKKGQ